MEITADYVKGMEILLVSADSLYDAYALYRYSVFWIRSFPVISVGKSHEFIVHLPLRDYSSSCL